MNKKRYSRDEVIELLKKRQSDRTQKELAEELGISQQFLCDMYAGVRDPGVKVLESLGMYREWAYYYER